MPTSSGRTVGARFESAILCALLAGCDEPGARAPGASEPVEAFARATSSEDGDRVVVPAGRVGADHVGSFAIDRTLVTRARFQSFVDTTGHLTSAEREGDGQVLELASGLWTITRGATFRVPRGPEGEPAASDHPATQVTLADAEAFCAWAEGRVPSEREWEHAARNGRDQRTAYPWGDETHPSGRARANTWEGVFPSVNTLRDGHLFVSPVEAFPPSPIGLRDIVGNVWHWTLSPFEARGGDEGDIALRGGSHLCDPDLCEGYRIDARQRAVRSDRFAHVGFRCVYATSVSEESAAR